MKFQKIINIAVWAIIGFSLVQCGKEDDKVTGPNTLEDVIMENEDPVLLADGVSSMNLVAVVNDTSGYPVSGLKVYFTTTHGTITESAVTNIFGEATAILTSEASHVDLAVTVRASLLDSTSLNKKVSKPYQVALRTQNQKSLKKPANTNEITMLLNFQFLGVQFSATMNKAELPADGINSAELKVVVKETTSKKAVNSASITLNALYNMLPQDVATGSDGIALTDIVSMPEAVTDTVFIGYGSFPTINIPLTYILPTLELMPKQAQISVGGRSELIMTARLLSHLNNPIIGAPVEFITTDGSITATAITNSNGDAQATLLSGSEVNENVKVRATFNSLKDSASVAFIESTVQSFSKLEGEKNLIRNGVESIKIEATLFDELYNPVSNTLVRFESIYGRVDSMALTDEEGIAQVTYITDADSADAIDVITATFGNNTVQLSINLIGVTMEVSANPDSIQADGSSSTDIIVKLKETTSRQVIEGATVNFNSTLGTIQSSAITNSVGTTSAELVSGSQAGIANVNVVYGGLIQTIPVIFASERPTTIILSAEPNYIWVKESGNLEQTTLTARVLTQTGSPVSSNISVRFTILDGPGGNEEIFPAQYGSTTVSMPIKTVNGEARATLKAGTRSGTIRIQAEVTDEEYDIQARIANVIVRSGPAYMWMDPDNINNVESHMSMAFDYLNQDGWNNVRQYQVTVYVGDRYNNPVEEGTTVYLTTTAGMISTDVKTDAMGIGSAILLSSNPKPVLQPGDPYVLAPHRIPNPNNSSLMLPITVPDYEFSQVTNTMGTLDENDGVAYVLATTRGCNQYLHQEDNSDSTIRVFALGSVIFSGPLYKFEVTTDREELRWGEVATLDIQVFDINGNPVAKGSQLNATASKGKLSTTKLMPNADKYGTGATHFQTFLLNNLDPLVDEAGLAEVTLSLDSPNGTGNQTIFINMTFDGYEKD